MLGKLIEIVYFGTLTIAGASKFAAPPPPNGGLPEWLVLIGAELEVLIGLCGLLRPRPIAILAGAILYTVLAVVASYLAVKGVESCECLRIGGSSGGSLVSPELMIGFDVSASALLFVRFRSLRTTSDLSCSASTFSPGVSRCINV